MLNRKALVLAGIGSLVIWSTIATAQVPVVEAGSRRGQPVAAQVQPEGNDLVLTLYSQLESLQQEVQTLRGLVEEQSNQIRRMQTENRDRYLDVDRRLSELSGAAAGTGAALQPLAGGLVGENTGNATLPPTGLGTAPASQQPFTTQQGANTAPQESFGNPSMAAGASPVAGPSTGAGAGAAPATGIQQSQTLAGTQVAVGGPMLAPSVQGPGSELGEQDLYRTALNILLEQQPARYEESIGMFQSYIQRFPQGDRLTNSYYWLGAALLLVERYEEARDILTTLITSYPDDPKAASALLTRGEVYQRLGQRDLAEQDWRSIATRYPESATEIREADTRLRRQ